MSWTHDPDIDSLQHPAGLVVRFERLAKPRGHPDYSDRVIEFHYQDAWWLGTVVRQVNRDKTGHDQRRLLEEARDEFVRLLRAKVDPFPD